VFQWLPGPAREIPRTTSASRDTPLFEFAFGPRSQASIGAEFGLVALRWPSASFRFAGHGMIALENAKDEAIFPPHELWRGLVGVSFSLSANALARRWFGQGAALEGSILLGHESDHEDDFHELPEADHFPSGGGDFIAPDIAVRIPAGRPLVLTVRLQDRAFLRGDILNSPGFDLALRLRLWPSVQPFVAVFAEQLHARDWFVRSSFSARALAGIAFPGKIGEVAPFLSFDAGAGKGLLINRREARLSVGVRYAFF
jgi:hypothetical protein